MAQYRAGVCGVAFEFVLRWDWAGLDRCTHTHTHTTRTHTHTHTHTHGAAFTPSLHLHHQAVRGSRLESREQLSGALGTKP